MNRETQTFKSPSGVDYEIVSKMSALERNTLRDLIFEATKMTASQGSSDVKQSGGDANSGTTINREIDLKFVSKMEAKLIEMTVKKYGEETSPKAILDLLLNSDPEEYDAVYKQAEKVHKETIDSFFKVG